MVVPTLYGPSPDAAPPVYLLCHQPDHVRPCYCFYENVVEMTEVDLLNRLFVYFLSDFWRH